MIGNSIFDNFINKRSFLIILTANIFSISVFTKALLLTLLFYDFFPEYFQVHRKYILYILFNLRFAYLNRAFYFTLRLLQVGYIK